MFKQRLATIYNNEVTVEYLNERLTDLVRNYRERVPALASRTWDETDALLISYGDSLLAEGQTPLGGFAEFAETHLRDVISFIHLLPFYPWSSDDGFAVKDFRAINPDLGNWDEIVSLGQRFRLVFDAVINHVSESSVYMEGYRAGDPAYRDFFISLPPDTDTSSVLRTRNLPLLHDYQTCRGTEWLWTTFSRDQLDLNFRNPAVLLEIADVLLGYLEKGAGMIRLDAIPYLWKQLGTSCAHLPQTHELIKLIHDLYQVVSPSSLLLTETNVPHHENIAYFGDRGDEAQMIYNFSLAPLIAHAVIRGDATVLSHWASQVGYISENATYLNITATHDGIGMRPTEGILPEAERQMMCDLAKARGGDITGKRNSDGSISVYELNITYFDLLNDPAGDEPLELQIERFLLSQTIPLSFIGIPGIYIHSLLGSRNYSEGVTATGRARSINREQLHIGELEAELAQSDSLRARVFNEYKRRLAIRAAAPCFSPDARQGILDLGPEVFALRREATQGTSVTAVHNVTNKPVVVRLDGGGRDLLSGESVGTTVKLAPYHVRWLVALPGATLLSPLRG
jgi:sucrose phosphorylase